MKRMTMILATLGILCVAGSQVQAHDFHHGHGPYYAGYRGPVVVRPYVRVAPPVVVAVPVAPPVYGYPYYCPGPSYGVYYQGRGLSIGVGF